MPAALNAPGVPPSLPALRHLVFAVTLAETGPVSDKPGGAADASPLPEGSASHGKIVVDVVAATGDGGLVVDVSQTPKGSASFTRVAVASDGELAYDPRVELTSEEIALLKLLGREVIGPTVRRPGDTWQIPAQGTGIKEAASFRVIDAPTPNDEVLDVTETYARAGALGGDGSMDGTLTYDPVLSVPLSASFVARMDVADHGSRATILTSVTLKLVEDSFAVEPQTKR